MVDKGNMLKAFIDKPWGFTQSTWVHIH